MVDRPTVRLAKLEKLSFDLGDREDVYEAGDAFAVPGGHVPRPSPGPSLQFSPADELEPVSDTMRRTMEAMQSA